MEIFNLEKLLTDIKSRNIYELNINERQLPFASYLVGTNIDKLTPLEEYEVLSKEVCIETIKKIEELFNISIDKDISILQKDDIKFTIVKGNASEGVCIMLKKSLNKNTWI